jgi:membrane protease YdiL (CAAX protease family)
MGQVGTLPPGQTRTQLVRIEPSSRRGLVLETWFVQLAFLFPGVLAAADMFAAHLSKAGPQTVFPSIITGHPLANLLLGAITYLGVGTLVPLALLLLARTGQPPAAIGLGVPRWRSDILPGVVLAVGAWATVWAVTIPLSVLIGEHKTLFSQVSTGRVPTYYIGYGVILAAVTAITEETLVNGYLLTRLEQFGWTPPRALVLSLVLRTSYHLYYGLGFLFTIPFGYFVTRSFQKHRRLSRPIVAHFVYDAALFAIGILAAQHA